MFYLETNSTNPKYNLAFEEYVLKNRFDGDYVILWQNQNTIVVGQNQNTAEEINQQFVEAHDITVVRRCTGGGAVYHDMGNINYSFITDNGEMETKAISYFTKPVVEALKELGLDAEASGRNDILVNGKKVSGTAQRIYRNRILHHGTLLFDSDPTMITGALNVTPDKFTSKSSKSVQSRVGNVRAALKEIGKDMEIQEFKEHLKTALATNYQFVTLSAAEEQAILALKSEKYDTWDWNFGKNPSYDFHTKKRFAGGTIDARFSVKKGKIFSGRFYGDFLSVKSLDQLECALVGRDFIPTEIEAVLKTFNLSELFGSITLEEILSLFTE